ncbi:hypothetical protein BJ138DRAFT_1013316 [Hygrophoropsis aurantiaca]|uniref:Uncharacterized protein n=1 Tax=Hygrophoropsis aurantiaca TaxID=72124 RepID=A0ACB8A514_9AGAM|nr:hypothetical protein BJ138DRAFT_1013316 [Hygrophoropsis aurantiaca]
MHREDRKSGFYDLPTPEEVAAFNPDNGPCCSADRFRIDISGFPKSKWNISAAEVFTKSFTDTHRRYRSQAKEVTTAWHIHFERLKEIHGEQQGRQSNAQAKKNRRWERKLQMYYRRMKAAQSDRKIRCSAVGILGELGVEGMSSDESDHPSEGGEPIYRILRKPWRAPALTPYLRTLDSLHLKTRYRGEWSASPGAWPHFRAVSLKTSQRRVTADLPRNFYANGWYSSCTPSLQRSLRAKSDKYTFTHPEELLQ